jgi:hypothetical protein
MALEGFVFDALDINDGANFTVQDAGFSFKPAQKQPQWVDNPDADGGDLAYEPHYTNSEFALPVRVARKLTMDTALEAWGELQDKVQKASLMRDQGGLPFIWTPKGSSRSYTWFALLGEVPEVPVTASGDLAGWFVNSPVFPVKLSCRPFGHLAERTLLAAVASGEVPLQQVELKGVGGDVPAEGRLIVFEKSAVDRRHLEWGLDQNEGTLLVTAAGLTTAGFTGVVKTRAGAYPVATEKVVRAVAVNAWTPMAAYATAMIGSYRVKARVFPTSEAARFRISYRVGDGPFKTLGGLYSAVAAAGINGYFEIDLGEVTFEEVIAGTQRAEVRIESMAAEGAPENDLNYLELMPTVSGYGKGRGLQSSAATQLLAYDEYIQSAGAATGKSPTVGSAYVAATNSDAAPDFEVDAVNHRLFRSSVSDTGTIIPVYLLGRAIGAGAAKYKNHMIAHNLTIPWSEAVTTGHIVRWVNAENFFVVYFTEFGGGGVGWNLLVGKYKAKVRTILREVENFRGKAAELSGRLETIVQDGAIAVYFDGVEVTTVKDADLATGGTHQEGQAFLYDHNVAAAAATRIYDNFEIVEIPPAGRVCFASRQAELRSDSDDKLIRQDATGTYDGPPSTYRGGRFYIPPAGDAGLVSRLAVKMRRNDVDTEPDTNVTDQQTIEVKVTERFLAPR